MTINFKNALGVHPDALSLRSQRAELLANNLANTDTPNFKARDIDFRAALEQATAGRQPQGLARTDDRHMAVRGTLSGDVGFRVPLHPAVDGNTVDAHAEQAAFARNTIEFQAGFTFLNSKFQGLKNAWRGE